MTAILGVLEGGRLVQGKTMPWNHQVGTPEGAKPRLPVESFPEVIPRRTGSAHHNPGPERNPPVLQEIMKLDPHHLPPILDEGICPSIAQGQTPFRDPFPENPEDQACILGDRIQIFEPALKIHLLHPWHEVPNFLRREPAPAPPFAP